MTKRTVRGKRQRLINALPNRIRHLIVFAILDKYIHEPEENGLVSPIDEYEKVFAYSDLLHTGKHVFEDKLYSVPVGYDNVLTTEYGDYMTPPPEENRGGHEQTLGLIINDVNRDYKEYQAELRSLVRAKKA